MPEVAGDGAVLVDPLSTESIRLGFLKVINDADFRQGVVERGYKNAKRFDTTSIADKYVRIYETIGRNGL